MLLCLYSYENFVDTILYGSSSIILEDVKVALNLKELEKRVMEVEVTNRAGPGQYDKTWRPRPGPIS